MDLVIGQILPYIAVIVFVSGVTWRIWRWMIPQIVHNITLSPFPHTWPEAMVWILWQFATFWNLFKFDRPLWVGGWIMHIGLFSALGGHIIGIPTEGAIFSIVSGGAISLEMSKEISGLMGAIFGIMFWLGLVFLLIRRVTTNSVRAISAPSDYLHLLLLLAIATIGNYMRLVHSAGIEYHEVNDYMLGLFLFSPQALPDNVFFVVKYSLVMLLMIIFPFSKLMHVFGFFWERWIVNRPFREPARGLPGAKLQLPK